MKQLTEEEIGEIYRAGWKNTMDFAESIQAKLKEKNTINLTDADIMEEFKKGQPNTFIAGAKWAIERMK
jgi:hypothetical protein